MGNPHHLTKRLMPAEISPDLLVPDGSRALVLYRGEPEVLDPSGRYRLKPGTERLEIRLIAKDAPCQRSLFFLDGTLVVILKPGPAAADRFSALEAFAASPVSRKQEMLVARTLQSGPLASAGT